MYECLLIYGHDLMEIEGDFFEIKYNNESQGKKYQKDVIWLRSLIFH